MSTTSKLTKPDASSQASPSPLGMAAFKQAHRLLIDCVEYRSLLSANRVPLHPGELCRADGWEVTAEFMDGDFALDEAVAGQLCTTLLKQDDGELPTWLSEYLFGGVSGELGSAERFGSELTHAVAGPGNVLSNLNTAGQAVNAHVQSSTQNKLTTSLKRVESGKARSLKINDYMTLYDANYGKKGAPRPYLRIKNLPIDVVTAAFDDALKISRRGGNIKLHMTNKTQLMQASRLRAEQHRSGRLPFLKGQVTGGILTFGVSAALDVVQR